VTGSCRNDFNIHDFNIQSLALALALICLTHLSTALVAYSIRRGDIVGRLFVLSPPVSSVIVGKEAKE